ncbi:MAG: hypothetical protein E7384_07125 [Ruminococcaceae bacterium]|nr:hypothetical protein [Oscillospiraceae bacterium]
MTELRKIHDHFHRHYIQPNNNQSVFAKHFQFIIAMRHTTTRMFTPQQNADFVGHSLNLSDWFSLDKIVEIREKWLIDNNFFDNEDKRLVTILSDKGISGPILRGLRLKLNLLFNNNKRLILDFLLSTLCDVGNADIIEYAEGYLTNENLPYNMQKYAYRSIIWRLVLDKLLDDELFKNFHSQFDGFEKYSALDYMRKILIILSNYALEHEYGYVSLTDLLKKLYPDKDNVSNWLCSTGCINERQKICHLLYFMNYYCRRDNNWFQFIDIQCNTEILNAIHIDSPSIFVELLEKGFSTNDFKIQITTSGKAYLGYVVQTFEFISSVYKNNPPLLSVIPTEEEVMLCNRIENMDCYRIIKGVVEKSITICKEINESFKTNHEISYYKDLDKKPVSYANAIAESHTGYIDNFCNCLNKLYSNNKDKTFKKNLTTLVIQIQRLRNLYKSI